MWVLPTRSCCTNTLGGEAGEELADAFARGCGEAALDLGDHERAVSVRQEGKYGAVQGGRYRREWPPQLHRGRFCSSKYSLKVQQLRLGYRQCDAVPACAGGHCTPETFVPESIRILLSVNKFRYPRWGIGFRVGCDRPESFSTTTPHGAFGIWSALAMGRECVSFAGSRGGSARVRGWLDFVSGRRCHIKNL